MREREAQEVREVEVEEQREYPKRKRDSVCSRKAKNSSLQREKLRFEGDGKDSCCSDSSLRIHSRYRPKGGAVRE